MLVPGECQDSRPDADQEVSNAEGVRVPARGPEDRSSLMSLYVECGGSSWREQDGWGTNMPLGQWHGVTEEGGRVVKLQLRGNNLEGGPAMGASLERG